jgi:hypothetical protein
MSPLWRLSLLYLTLFACLVTWAAALAVPIRRLDHRPTTRARARPGSSIALPGGILNLGEYFVELELGAPPATQRARVHLDTGSSTLAIFDRACSEQDCGVHDFAPYNQQASASASNVSCDFPACQRPCDSVYGQCAFAITYGDGSGARGAWGRDRVTIGPFSAIAPFGRITNATAQADGPPFEPEYLNGIFGIAFASLNCLPSCMPTVLDAMVEQGAIDALFGMCLTEAGGVWDLGAIDEAKFAPHALAWLPILDDSYYTVPIAGGVLRASPTAPSAASTGAGSGAASASAAPVVVPMPHVRGAPTIFDSGTTLLLGPDNWFQSLVAILGTNFPTLPSLNELLANNVRLLSGVFSGCTCTNFSCICFWALTIFAGNYSPQPDVCTDMSAAEIAQWPSLDFAFSALGGGEATARVAPQSYILRLNDSLPSGGWRQCCVLGIATSGDYGGFILGDVFLQNFYAAYDIARRRVGFAPVTDCRHEMPPSAPTGQPTDVPPTPSPGDAGAVLGQFFSAPGLVVGAACIVVLAAAAGACAGRACCAKSLAQDEYPSPMMTSSVAPSLDDPTASRFPAGRLGDSYKAPALVAALLSASSLTSALSSSSVRGGNESASAYRLLDGDAPPRKAPSIGRSPSGHFDGTV